MFMPSDSKLDKIHWMPRKTLRNTKCIGWFAMFTFSQHGLGWTVDTLENMSHNQIAHFLNKSKIFLSSGHPEGFGRQSLKPWHQVVGL